MMNDHWIEIKPEEYLFDVSEAGDRSICHIAMLGNNYNFFLMGLPFFQGYYTIHDMDAPQIGYIPTIRSSKSYLKQGPVPTQILEPIVHNYPLEYGPLIFLAAVAALYYYVVYPALYPKYDYNTPTFIAVTAGYWIFWGLFFLFIFYPLLIKFFAPEEVKKADDKSQVNDVIAEDNPN
jgi:hypothetical protein